MRHFNRWMRDVLPGRFWVCFAGLSILISRGVLAWLAATFPDVARELISETSSGSGEATFGPAGVPLLFCILYGVLRATSRNPALRHDYRNWLANSPWRWPLPLPWGAVVPVWQDALVLAALTLLTWGHPGLPGWGPLAVVAGSYTLGLSVAVLSVRPRRELYFVIAAALAAIHFHHHPGITATALLAALLAASCAMRRLLIEFQDWPVVSPVEEINNLNAPAARLGWPWGVLSPQAGLPRVPWTDGLISSLLVGCATYLICASEVDATALATGILPALMCLGLLLRHNYYHAGIAPPLSVAGRLRTGRLILPGYDVVFAPALFGTLCYGGLGLALYFGAVSEPVMNAIVVAAAWGVLLFMPPAAKTWWLTGELRLTLRPGALNRTARSDSRRGNRLRR